MTDRYCLACRDSPVTDTFTCSDCAAWYHYHLMHLPDLARDLDIEITRQGRKGGSGGDGGRSRNFDRPLEFNQAASDALGQLRAVLVSTCLTLALGQRLPSDTINAMVEWLIVNEAALGRDERGAVVEMVAGRATSTGRLSSPRLPVMRWVNCARCWCPRV